MKRFTLILIFASILLTGCSPKRTPDSPLSATPEDAQVNSNLTATSIFTANPTEELTSTPTTPPTPTFTPAPPKESSTLPDNYPEEGLGPDNFPANFNPLTGLPVGNSALLDRGPIGIKITLFPRYIRPQWGLSKADLVFEYYHNGGITRFHAIFYGQDVEQVAPIRSARFSDENFIKMYKSTLTFGGSYQDVIDHFYSSTYANRLLYTATSHPCPPPEGYPVCRYQPETLNYLLGSTKLLRNYFKAQGVDSSRQNLNGMFFNKIVPDSDSVGKELRIRYTHANYHLWKYDPEIEEYVRYQEKTTGEGEEYEVLVDRITNIPISADNVVVLVVEHADRESSHEAIDIQLHGTGDAYAFRDGKLYALKWNRPAEDSVLYLSYPDGELYPFRPGATWFELVGRHSEVQDQDNGLRIQAYIP